jgi:hypothetical protein
MAYRVSPFQKEDSKPEPAPNTTETRLAALEEKLNTILNNGGKFDGLL